MTRRLAQILAVVTMMASIVNAQCAISCSFLSTVESSRASQVLGGQEDHSCCPHHGSPDRQPPGTPCDHTTTRADAARLEINGVAAPIVVPVVATVRAFPEFLSPLTSDCRADRMPAPDSSGLWFRSVSVLRI